MEHIQTGLPEEFLRRLAAAIRAAQLYSAHHPIIARNVRALSAAAAQLHGSWPAITVGIVGNEIVVGEVPIGHADALGDVLRRLQAGGIERMAIERGVDDDELTALVRAVATVEPRRSADEAAPAFPSFAHIRVGRIQMEARVDGGSLADMATIRRLYSDAVSVATDVWDSAATEHQPDTRAARTMVDGLAQALTQNRTALVALTALKEYDNYTFTHMVNVSILTMGQARGLGIEGPLLREFGFSGLMHDIGKVRTPPEILNKPDKLNDAEFTIMKRHTLDGAEILRKTTGIPALAPVVAFEHHLRLDGSGYPDVARRSLNLCTMLCTISDVYDAMRSQRRYQQAFPTDRILQVMQRDDGLQFDRHLVRRFVQLLGIYPAGNLVQLDTGEIAVVVRAYAPDPYRPQVRVLFDRHGTRLSRTYDIPLWETPGGMDAPPSIKGPLNPAEYGLDPLTLL